MISVTEKAINKLKEISSDEGIGHLSVRVKILGGGCAGFTYDMFFDDVSTEMDEITELDGIKIIIDPLSFQYLDGVTIDYLEGLMGAGFKFINPNSTGSCGCGNSFSA